MQLAQIPLIRCASAVALALLSVGAAAAEPAIIGTWKNLVSPEQMVFKPNGDVHSCFGTSQRGNAAMGHWVQTRPGHFKVEFTHATSPVCKLAPAPSHQFQVKIEGAAKATATELQLFVSGEGPPDRYRRVPVAKLP